MVRKRYTLASLNYFIFFACMGSFVPYITLFLKNEGWSGTAIGIYAAIGPLISFITQPFWGFVGDSISNPRLLFAVLIVLAGIAIRIFGFLQATPIFYLLAVLVGFFEGPLGAILDSMTVRILGDEKNKWGKTRLWGSVGFSLLSLLIGRLFAKKTSVIFSFYVLGALTAVFSIFRLPEIPIDSNEKKPLVRGFSFKDLGQVLTGPFLSFLLVMFLLELAQHLPSNFLSVIMTDRGASASLVGLVWSVSALVEIPMFLATPKLLEKAEPEHLLIAAGLFNAFRLALFAVSFHPLLMLLAQALQGPAYAVNVVAIVLIVDRLVHPKFHATGFTLQVAFVATLPSLVGGVLAGQIYDRLGGTALFLVSAFLTLAGVGALNFWRRKMAKRKSILQTAGEHENLEDQHL